MKLSPIRESEYYSKIFNKTSKKEKIYNRYGEEILVLDHSFSDDIVEIYETGCLIKIDYGCINNNEKEKCYLTIFLDNKGEELLSLHDYINDEKVLDPFNLNSEGRFEVEVERTGLNIIYHPIDGSSAVSNRYSYSELKDFSGLSEDMFLMKLQQMKN